MVLRGVEGQQGLAVGQAQQRALGTLEHLLDHDDVAGLAERVEALVDAGEGLLGVLRDDDALAGGQAVGLDHDGATELAHVGGALVLVGEGTVGGGGDTGALHDLLGELLGALHLGGLGTGAEARDAGGADRVSDAGD